MKTIARSIVVGLISAASVASAAVPSITVTVQDSSGKTAYKGATSSKGTFATGKLQPGGYVVRFDSKSAPKGSTYVLVVSAGSKKVVASAIEAAILAAGGAAMKIDVAAGLNITGQVAEEDKNISRAPMGKNGKPMVWLPKQIGSNLAARWVESDSPDAKLAQTSSSYSIKNMQDKQNQGSVPNDRGGR